MKKYCIEVTEQNEKRLNVWLHANKHKFPKYNEGWEVKKNNNSTNYFHFGINEHFHSSLCIEPGYELVDSNIFGGEVKRYVTKDSKYNEPWRRICKFTGTRDTDENFVPGSSCEKRMFELDLQHWFETTYHNDRHRLVDGRIFFLQKLNVSIPISLLNSGVKSMSFDVGETLTADDLNRAKIWYEINK